MAAIPEKVRRSAIVPSLERFLISQGKVRDIYQHPMDDGCLLLVATNRISIFDFVLPALVAFKGSVLTALTHFWLTGPLKDFPHHLVLLDGGKNAALELKKDHPDLPLANCMVVRKVEIPPFEMVFRHHLGGSVYKNYLESGIVCGQELPPGIQKWAYLEEPLFTPATKSEEGHDITVDVNLFYRQMGENGRESMEMFRETYKIAYAFARERGILILDTKFEGLDTIADEVLTPDSSRFTTVEDWRKAMKEGKDPVFYDKELVRVWGRTVNTPWDVGIDKLNPKDPEHVEFVHSLEVPEVVVKKTSKRYLQIIKMLTGMSLLQYQRRMGVHAN